MNRSTFSAARLVAGGCMLVTTALVSTAAAQPPEGREPPAFRDPLRRALDANHDFELDADEIAKAPEVLKSLDKNGDGKIDREELRPPMGPPPGGAGRGPEGRGFEGRPPHDRDSFDRPPPPRDGAGGPPRPREGFRPGGGDAGGRPSPERFVDRAMSFDADGDGKLDRAELEKLADLMAERIRAAVRGPGGPGGPPREGGERPQRPRRPE